ncbi:DUF4252 domain-containing protein [Flavobacterium sp.]|uniref:DUF4252 domain-containing protein n=1 Tax=Flavobacterium sp. TaxID=239 RepID=UPI00352720A5
MIKKIIILVVAISILSCSNKPSLQKYFVENSESPAFIAIDLGSSILNTEKLTLTDTEKEALDSFEKLNILAFQKDSLNTADYTIEKEKLTQILKEEQYQPLMQFGGSKGNVALYLVGNEDNIKEIVVYAASDEKGFTVARFLGNKMNPNSILTLVNVFQKANVDLEQLKPLTDALKSK